ncbi:MAG: ribonuclease HI family protein [Myxococcales bacterium]|nr:ribonuclease HI family protein [Myxococcales bacterium]
MIATPSQLLLAIAEHETLEKACAALRISKDDGLKLLRGAAVRLQNEKPAEPAVPLDGHRKVYVFSDGAARGNPGPAGAGAVIKDANGKVIAELKQALGKTTNNVAEYKGLLLGLQEARKRGVREVEVRADSELMIRQLNGKYAVRNDGLKPLHNEAMALLNSFAKWNAEHVPREENAEADAMSNRAIDEP